jgi:5-methyltetrahydrofolate--homocysteine methyltransferase
VASQALATLSGAVKDGDYKQAVAIVNDELAAGTEGLVILNEGLVPGIEALGAAFRDGQAYLPEVLLAARAMNKAVEVLTPHLPKGEAHRLPTVVVGTVSGDMHDIGKNLVRMMLDCAGFKVVDLGVDVAPQAFVDAAKEHNASIVALSALLTTTMVNMPEVVTALKDAGVTASVMVGGAPLSRSFAEEIGAAGFAEDCLAAVDEAKRLAGV